MTNLVRLADHWRYKFHDPPEPGYCFQFRRGRGFEIWFWHGDDGFSLSAVRDVYPKTLKEARRLAWEHWVMRGDGGSYREIKGRKT